MFNKETEYALRALVYIQQANVVDKKPGVIEIASEIGAPQHYVAKILQKLAKSGFVQSQKGKGGGFYFPDDAKDFPIKDIIVFIEGDSLLTSCGFGLHKCDSNNPCPLHHKFAPIRLAISDLVSEETIKSLAAKSNIKKDFLPNFQI